MTADEMFRKLVFIELDEIRALIKLLDELEPSSGWIPFTEEEK